MAEQKYTTDDCYIVFSAYGVERMTKKRGSLKVGEISVRVRLSVPTKCLSLPTVSAVITVPESAINQPQVAVDVMEAAL